MNTNLRQFDPADEGNKQADTQTREMSTVYIYLYINTKMWQHFNDFQNIFTLTNLINESNQNYIFSLFSHSCTLHLTKFPMFHYHEHITKFRAKTMTFYSCAKSWKNYDLHSIFSHKFMQKKIFFFRINAKFCAKLVSYWFEISSKKVISCKNTKILRKTP